MSRRIVEDWFAAFRSKDISMLHLTEDFVHHSPYGEIKGRQTYLDLINENREAFFNPKLTILDIFECGDKFAARYLVNGNPACDCFYIRDGQIAEIHAYYHVGQKPTF